jgi:hypothetical protein
VLDDLEQEFIAHSAGGTGRRRSLPEATILLRDPVIELLARRSLIALIRELEEQLAGLQDVADQVIRSRSSGALADIQRQLLQTGINSRIVVNDIVRYAQDPFWKHGVVDFTEVAPPSLQCGVLPRAAFPAAHRQATSPTQPVGHAPTRCGDSSPTKPGSANPRPQPTTQCRARSAQFGRLS